MEGFSKNYKNIITLSKLKVSGFFTLFYLFPLCVSQSSPWSAIANMNYKPFPFLARNFGSVQGVCLLDTGYVLLYIEDVQTGKNNEVITQKNR